MRHGDVGMVVSIDRASGTIRIAVTLSGVAVAFCSQTPAQSRMTAAALVACAYQLDPSYESKLGRDASSD